MYKLLSAFTSMYSSWGDSFHGFQSREDVDKLVNETRKHMFGVPLSFRLRPRYGKGVIYRGRLAMVIFVLPCSIHNRFERVTRSVSSIFYASVGEIAQALKYADEVVEYIKILGVPYHDAWAVTDLFQVAQIHLRLDQRKFQEDLELLESMSLAHPISLLACKRLVTFRSQWEHVKDNPNAFALTPFALSSFVELFNTTDSAIFPWPGLPTVEEVLGRSIADVRAGYSLVAHT